MVVCLCKNVTSGEIVEHIDHGTDELFRHILEGEEEHIDWLETQIDLFDKLGDKAYLAEQLKS